MRTGINTGNVHVEVYAGAPTNSRGEWEEEAKARVWSPTGSLRIESVVDGPRLDLPILSTSGPGWYPGSSDDCFEAEGNARSLRAPQTPEQSPPLPQTYRTARGEGGW